MMGRRWFGIKQSLPPRTEPSMCWCSGCNVDNPHESPTRQAFFLHPLRSFDAGSDRARNHFLHLVGLQNSSESISLANLLLLHPRYRWLTTLPSFTKKPPYSLKNTVLLRVIGMIFARYLENGGESVRVCVYTVSYPFRNLMVVNDSLGIWFRMMHNSINPHAGL